MTIPILSLALEILQHNILKGQISLALTYA